jgi:hypothetical protein
MRFALLGFTALLAGAVTATGIDLVAQAPPSSGSSETASALAPPFPNAPRLGETCTTAPVLAWHNIEGARGARVELSPTLDFPEQTIRRFDVAGERLVLPSPWPAGTWYWRLRGLSHGVLGERSTPTWSFIVESPGSATAVHAGARRYRPRDKR